MTKENTEKILSDEEFEEISSQEPVLREDLLVETNHPNEDEVEPSQETVPDSLAASTEQVEHTLDSDNADLRPQYSNPSDSYFDDDEEFLMGDDKPIHENFDLSLFKQNENVISWEIVNFYKDGQTPRGKTALRSDPPIMKISSSSGDTAEFLVTKEFARSLSEILQDVNRAYYGISPKKNSKAVTQEGIKEKFQSLGQWMLDHKFKTAVAVVVVALLALALFS